MNSYYVLILINLIGLLLFINQSAIAVLSSNIVLDTFQDNKLTNISTCDVTSPKYLSSINKRSKADIPQASIWWAAEQFDPFGGNLIQDWLTYPQKQQAT